MVQGGARMTLVETLAVLREHGVTLFEGKTDDVGPVKLVLGPMQTAPAAAPTVTPSKRRKPPTTEAELDAALLGPLGIRKANDEAP